MNRGLMQYGGLVVALGNGVLAVEGQAETHVLEPLVVTADKYEQPWKYTSNTISVYSGEFIENRRVGDVDDLARYTPGLGFQPSGQSGFNTPVMRGLSANPTSFSSSTLLLVDGVPILSSSSGFTDAMLDLEQVEVLRGPQSSLYGRNADGGVISLRSREPVAAEEYAGAIALGSRQRKQASLTVNQPLVGDDLLLRIAGDWRSQDGFVDNLASGGKEDDRRRFSGAVSLRWLAGDATDLVLRYRTLDFDDGGAHWGAIANDDERVTSATDSRNNSRGDLVSLNVEQALSDGMTLHAITGWHNYDEDVRQDTDYTTAPLFAVARDFQLETVSQEVRLNGRESWGAWLVGVYADHIRRDLLFTRETPMSDGEVDARSGSTSYSLFNQWRFLLGERWALVAGGRLEYNREEGRNDLGLRGDESWTDFSPTVALQRDIGTGSSLYLRYAEGVRAGGFNLFSPPTAGSDYEPQTVTSWELGLKGNPVGSGLRYEIALYHMFVDQMHVQQIVGPGQVLISNAAEGRSQGVEASATYRPAASLELRAALAVNDAEFREFSSAGVHFDGNRLPFSAPVSGALGVRYEQAGGWFGQADITGSDRVFIDPANDGRRKGYARLDLALGRRFGRGEVTLYADNLTDETYHAKGLLNGTTVVYSEPREIGLSIDIHY